MTEVLAEYKKAEPRQEPRKLLSRERESHESFEVDDTQQETKMGELLGK